MTELPAIYRDEQGRRITTHSMLKSFARCPNQARYKYAERLKKRYLTARDKPLRRGTWFHCLLEEKYAGRSWRKKHKELTAEFNALMDEEKEALGDLPIEMLTLMKSYEWHYGANKEDPLHGWDVLGTEVTFDVPWPDSEDGMDIYRCRIDTLYRDPFGFWIGDHKTHARLPDTTFRLLDKPSVLYVWAARESGHDVDGFVWNYIRTKPPSVPVLLKDGTRISKSACDTDYPTMRRALIEYELDLDDYKHELKRLKSHRYKEGAVQTSNFFRRDILEKDDGVIERVLAAAMKTRDRMHEYDYSSTDEIERTEDRSCSTFCSYTELCTTELYGGNAKLVRKQQYRAGDPLDYYKEVATPDGD